MLRRLEKLQKQINAAHAKQCADSQKAGINLARKATLDAIEASAAADDSAAPALLTHNTGNADADADAVAAPEPTSSLGPPMGPPRLPPRARSAYLRSTNPVPRSGSEASPRPIEL